MAYGKKNHVKVDPTNFGLMLLAPAKQGKTTLIKEAMEIMGKNYLFVELKSERGADAIEGISYINCPSWSEEYNEDDNSIGWEELVDDICENPTDYNLDCLIMDTYDQYITMAENRVIQLHNKQNPDKRTTQFNACFGGFGAPAKKAIEIMFESIERLNAVGVKVWWIGHTKLRTITDETGEYSYDILTSDQQSNYFNALKKNLAFICTGYTQREIGKEKGKVNPMTKKADEKSIVKAEARKIRFRDSNFVMDCGSRFADIQEECDMDAQQFVDVLMSAIKAEIEKGGSTLADREKEDKAASEKRAKEIAEAEEKNKAKKEVDAVIEKINDYLKENKADLSKVKPILAKCKEIAGVKTPAELTKLEDALAVLEVIEA